MRHPEFRPLAVLLAAALIAGASFADDAPAGGAVASPAEDSPERGTRRVIGGGPGGGDLEIAAGPGSVLGKDELILKEYVDIRFGTSRLQADYVRYLPATREAYAEGNVILDQGQSRLTADSLVYNLETETGIFFKAHGYAEPSFYFEAERVEKISANELVLHDATFTACTQPIPYWSFRVGRGLLRLDDYAYLHNLSFKVGRVTIFYTPYLVWPIKTDRASGLLFPEFGFSNRGGTVISNAFYWAMRRNMDATFHLDYLSLAGFGEGVEYRYVPNQTGKGYFTGYYIRDQVAKNENRPGVPVDRWVINYGHNQDFDSGWRLVSRANFISDFNYFLDFERDIRISTNPQALSDVFLTRNWGFYSLNLRGERREQLVNVNVPPRVGDPPVVTEQDTIVRWIQPEVELRGRRQRLGKSPFFLALESSADWFRLGDIGASYQRLDVSPVLSSQLSAVPWLDVDASLGYRDTYYTSSQTGDHGCDNIPNTNDYGEGNGKTDDGEQDDDPKNGVFDSTEDVGCDGIDGTGDFGENNGVRDLERSDVVVDDSFNRNVIQGGLTLIGPKISRVFDTPSSSFSPQYKHTIEPTLRYSYLSSVENPEQVIRFDEIDSVVGNVNRLTYSLVTRLYAKRPGGEMRTMLESGPASARYVGGDDPFAELRENLRREREAEGGDQQAAGATTEAEAHKETLSTVEVATLEISQDYSFLGPLSRSVALDQERQVSPIHANLRINPSIRASVDVRTSWDILYRDLKEASLSASLRGPERGFVDLTWSLVRDLEGKALQAQGRAFTEPFDRSQIGLAGETNLFGRRVLLGMQTNYELGDVLEGEPRLRDQRYRFGYNTQCCGFQFEVLNRNYSGSSQREFRFLINLKGVGNVIDLNSGSTEAF